MPCHAQLAHEVVDQPTCLGGGPPVVASKVGGQPPQAAQIKAKLILWNILWSSWWDLGGQVFCLSCSLLLELVGLLCFHLLVSLKLFYLCSEPLHILSKQGDLSLRPLEIGRAHV